MDPVEQPTSIVKSTSPEPSEKNNQPDEVQSILPAGKCLYLSEKFADVHFTFASDERIPANKCVLSSANQVFDRMFNGSLKEDNEIEIVDASAEAFKAFLKFFYFNKVDTKCVTMDTVSDMMNLANKYDVIECMNVCRSFLKDSLQIENVCSVLDLALLFNLDEIADLCEEMINRDSFYVLNSEDFSMCSKRVLNHIVQQSTLNCSEVRLFRAIMSWIKAKTEHETLTRDIVMAEIGDLFYKFRFRSMSLKEFVSLIPSYGKLFTQDEEHEILQMIASEAFEPKYFHTAFRFRDDDGLDTDDSHDYDEEYDNCSSDDVWLIDDDSSVDENYEKFLESLKPYETT